MAKKKMGDDLSQDKKMVEKAVGQHEKAMHEGKKRTKLHLAFGGMVGNLHGHSPVSNKGMHGHSPMKGK